MEDSLKKISDLLKNNNEIQMLKPEIMKRMDFGKIAFMPSHF